MMIPFEVDTSLLGYENIIRAFNTIQAHIDIHPAMLTVKVLASSFILLNILKKWSESRLNTNISLTPWDIITSFAYILLIFGYTEILYYIEGFGKVFEGYILESINTITDGMTIKSYYESTPPRWGTFSVGIINLSSILIGILDFIGWLVNTMAFAGFMIERGFLLILLNLTFPFVICLATLKSFRELLLNWVRLYFSVYLIAVVLLAGNVVIDALYSALLSNYIEDETGLIDTSDWIRVVLVFTLVFSKVMIYKGGINYLSKLLKV